MRKKKPGRLKLAFDIFKGTFNAFNEDKVVKLSAALSYYTIFSLPPLILVIIGLSGVFFGREAVQGEVFSIIKTYVGAQAAMQIQDIIKQTTLNHDSTIATIIGIGTLLLGATGIFGEIQDSLNFIWGLKASPKKGLMRMLVNRLMSFSMILVLAFIFMVSLLLSTLISSFVNRLKAHFNDDWVDMLYYVNTGVVFLCILTLFTFIFKILPDARVRWKQAISGALMTSILFMVGEQLIGLYLERNTTISAYGAAGSIIILLLWVYYSSLILYIGAEFTQVYTRHKGLHIEPNKYAVRVEKERKEKPKTQAEKEKAKV